jgi:hypothetical protein
MKEARGTRIKMQDSQATFLYGHLKYCTLLDLDIDVVEIDYV